MTGGGGGAGRVGLGAGEGTLASDGGGGGAGLGEMSAVSGGIVARSSIGRTARSEPRSEPRSGSLRRGDDVDPSSIGRARDGAVEVRPMMTMTLTVDHRAVDGAAGADFLRTVKQFVEDPALAL